MAEPSEDTLLDLSTEVQRKSVVIDGERYSMRHPDEFSFAEQKKLRASSQKIDELLKSEHSDDETLDELERTPKQVVAMVMPDLPKEVADRLTDDQRLSIVNAFSKLSQVSEETETTSQ